MDGVLKHLVSTKYCSFERSFRAKNCLISLFRALELLNIVAERIKMNKSKDKENPLQDSPAHQFCLFWYEYFRKTISYRKYWLDFKYPILSRTQMGVDSQQILNILYYDRMHMLSSSKEIKSVCPKIPQYLRTGSSSLDN